MAVPSDGSYGIPKGLIFSFPVTIDGATKEWKIVKDLPLDDFAKEKIQITTKVRRVLISLASRDDDEIHDVQNHEPQRVAHD